MWNLSVETSDLYAWNLHVWNFYLEPLSETFIWNLCPNPLSGAFFRNLSVETAWSGPLRETLVWTHHLEPWNLYVWNLPQPGARSWAGCHKPPRSFIGKDLGTPQSCNSSSLGSLACCEAWRVRLRNHTKPTVNTSFIMLCGRFGTLCFSFLVWAHFVPRTMYNRGRSTQTAVNCDISATTKQWFAVSAATPHHCPSFNPRLQAGQSGKSAWPDHVTKCLLSLRLSASFVASKPTVTEIRACGVIRAERDNTTSTSSCIAKILKNLQKYSKIYKQEQLQSEQKTSTWRHAPRLRISSTVSSASASSSSPSFKGKLDLTEASFFLTKLRSFVFLPLLLSPLGGRGKMAKLRKVIKVLLLPNKNGDLLCFLHMFFLDLQVASILRRNVCRCKHLQRIEIHECFLVARRVELWMENFWSHSREQPGRPLLALLEARRCSALRSKRWPHLSVFQNVSSFHEFRSISKTWSSECWFALAVLVTLVPCCASLLANFWYNMTLAAMSKPRF